MIELNCEIKEITKRGENEYFLINSIEENQNYIIPVEQLLKYNIKIGEFHIFEKKLNKNSQKYFLEYLYHSKPILKHHYYDCGQIYEFKIINIEPTLNKKGNTISIISVEDVDKNIITVLGLKWQTKDLWKFDPVLS